MTARYQITRDDIVTLSRRHDRRSYLRRYKNLDAHVATGHQVELTDDGIHLHVGGDWSHLTWDRIASWRRFREFLIIQGTLPRQDFILPLSVADQGFDIDSLTRLLSEKVTGARR
jgi:3',5'-cyclic AMP phosphodiesterase CpdA